MELTGTGQMSTTGTMTRSGLAALRHDLGKVLMLSGEDPADVVCLNHRDLVEDAFPDPIAF